MTDCNLHWLKDKKEWKGTDAVWEVSRNNGTTVTAQMTHIGLVSGIECYDECKKGWNFYLGESLLTENKGLPDQENKSR